MATSGWTTWCSMRQRWVEGEGEGEGEREGAWGASRTHVERGGEGREAMGLTGRKGEGGEEGQGARVRVGGVKRGGSHWEEGPRKLDGRHGVWCVTHLV